MKLVDVPDSKSGVVHPTCRFDSGHRQIKRDTNVSLFIWLMQELNPKRQLYRFGASELRLEHFCVCANSTLAKCGMPLNASEQDTPAIGIFYCSNAFFTESNLSAPRIKRILLTPFILCSACGSHLSQNNTQSFCSAEWPSANKKRH